MRLLRIAGAWLLAAGMTGATALGAWRLWTASDDLPGIHRDTQLISGTVEAGPTDIQLAATLSVTATASGVVNAPAWAGGTVTWLPTKTVIENGADIIEVDGVRSVLCAGRKPFYRPMTLGDTGADVVAVRGCLGLDPRGSVTRDVLVALAKRLDLLDPRTRELGREVRALPTTRLVWAPNAPVRLERFNTALGDVVPAAGSPLATLARGVRVGQLAIGGLSSSDAAAVLASAKSRTFTFGAEKVPVKPDQTVVPGTVDWATAAHLGGAGDEPNGATTAGAAPSEGVVKGTVTLAFERTAVVASSALYTGRGGGACVAAKAGSSWVAVAVAPVPYGWGQAMVDPSLQGKVVALNPQSMGDDLPACLP